MVFVKSLPWIMKFKVIISRYILFSLNRGKLSAYLLTYELGLGVRHALLIFLEHVLKFCNLTGR